MLTAIPVLVQVPASGESATGTLQRLYENPNFTMGWGCLALINAGLAQGKNRSGLNWFFASVFLGPIATFILVALCDKLPAAR